MVFEYPVAGPEAYAADPCVPLDTETQRFTTDQGTEFVRTPDSAFAGLADAGYPWAPNYAIVEGMQMHFVDAGPSDADEIVLMLHGQPSWSFLYRKMVPVLVDRGFRVICPDWIGMGRSDKPVELSEHTYLKQVDRLKAFISRVIPQALDNPTITLFVQDWGALIGLRTVGDQPSWFRRVISANGLLPVLPTNLNPFTAPEIVNYNCSDTRSAQEMAIDRFTSRPCGLDESCFSIWIEYALTSPTFQASELLQLASTNEINDTELLYYDAPFPSRIFTSAIRTFPSMMAGVHEPEFGNIAAWESLQNFSRPYLTLAGENDPNLGSVEVQSNLYNNIVGAQIHTFEHKRYSNAGHFIQEDAGAEVATYVADFMEGTVHLLGNDLSSSSSPEVDVPTAVSSTTSAAAPQSQVWILVLALYFTRHIFTN